MAIQAGVMILTDNLIIRIMRDNRFLEAFPGLKQINSGINPSTKKGCNCNKRYNISGFMHTIKTYILSLNEVKKDEFKKFLGATKIIAFVDQGGRRTRLEF